MSRAFLLGFVRDCRNIPMIEGFTPRLTQFSRYGVIWIPSPLHLFSGKKEFLAFMSKWLERVCYSKITMLPVQLGISADEDVLPKIIGKYRAELEQCLKTIAGCWEYDLNLNFTKTGLSTGGHSISSIVARNGREYLERMRKQSRERETFQREVHQRVAFLTGHLTPWIKDYALEMSPSTREAELAFLVPHIYNGFFRRDLQHLMEGSKEVINWTGPWPPFHFSSFKFRADGDLISEVLAW